MRHTSIDCRNPLTRKRTADLWSLKGLDRRKLCSNSCVATNLTIRRINRRDSAVIQFVVGAALGGAKQRNLAHCFTWLDGYQLLNLFDSSCLEFEISCRAIGRNVELGKELSFAEDISGLWSAIALQWKEGPFLNRSSGGETPKLLLSHPLGASLLPRPPTLYPLLAYSPLFTLLSPPFTPPYLGWVNVRPGIE